MRFIYIIFLLLISQLFVLGQNKEDLIKYKEILSLQNKRDSLEVANNYCKLPYLKKQIQKLDKKIEKERLKNTKLLNRIDSILTFAYHTGDSLYEQGQYDLALTLLSPIMKLYEEHILVRKIDYLKVTNDLVKIYTIKRNKDLAVYFFSKSIDFGNQDYDKFSILVSEFYPESKFFYMPLLDKMNKKLFDNNKDSLYTIKTVLRLMYLCDQIPRRINYPNQKNTQVSDSLNMHLLGYLIDNNLISKFTDLGDDYASIQIILHHSVYVSDLSFFEKYFTIYVSNLNWGLYYHQDLVDRYLNRTRHTQCFGTEKDRLPNGKFDYVPIENKDTIKKILLEKLKIEPKYIEELK